MSENIKAQWEIRLLATCPHCGEPIDLMDDELLADDIIPRVGDFLDSKNEIAECPECHQEFTCDFEY